jgi:hypothetical protein
MKKSIKSQIFLFLILIFLTTSLLKNFHGVTINSEPRTPDLETSSSFPTIPWASNGIAISTAINDQWATQIINDGMGGAIIVWMDERNGDLDIYAQRINSTGDIQWNANGIPICNANHNQYDPQITSDGEGGAIIVWYDFRNEIDYDIYAQRINSTGEIQWNLNGKAICTETGNQMKPKIISDGLGNMIIIWHDSRSGVDKDIYAQKINLTGEGLWTDNGTTVCTASNDQVDLELTDDEEGGAIIVWRDYRNNVNNDIYAQRINSTGFNQWNANGTVICNEDRDQYESDIISDNQGGAIITWTDKRNGPGDIFAQRINSTGFTQWALNGTGICTFSGDQYFPRIIRSGIDGAIIVWIDHRSDTTDIYTQKIDFTGNSQWTSNGTSICTESYSQVAPAIVNNGADGAFITWYDDRSGTNFDIYAQLINSTGDIQWSTNGEAVCTAPDDQKWPSIAYDDTKGAIIAWSDDRGGYSSDIYAQKIVDNDNPTSNHPNSLMTERIGTETIDWILVDDIEGGMFRVWANDTTGDYYIWQNWQPWVNNTSLNIPINRSAPGDFNYTIEYYDIYNQYGKDDTVIVTIIDNIPVSNHPIDIITSKGGGDTIVWTLTDDFGGGMYRVWANDTTGDYYVWQDWQSWENSTSLYVSINRTAPGNFNYTIEYHDNNNKNGVPDMVIVQIIDNIPISNHPIDIITSKGGGDTIDWILTDDFGGGMYRVWANDTTGDYYVWQDWQPWVSNVPFSVQINRSTLGTFNYTIEYYDNNNKFGIPSTVIVTITIDPVSEVPLISLGSYSLVFMVISVVSITFLKKKKISNT